MPRGIATSNARPTSGPKKPAGLTPTIEAVFRSGQGRDEQALPAQIIAADLSDEMNVDLAFLMVKGVNQPPAPIDPMARILPIISPGQGS